MSIATTVLKICRQKFYQINWKVVISIDTKNYILDKYYNEHVKPTIIAKELNVNPSYITKIVKSDMRYIGEKEYRANISKENRKIAKREWIRNKRQNEVDKELYEFVKMQHIEASKELSYTTEISDLTYRKWNPSAYHRNSKGNLVIDRKLKVGSDIPKSINMNIKVPTQKYRNRCLCSY